MDSYTSNIEAEFSRPFQLRDVQYDDEDDNDSYYTNDVWLDCEEELRPRERKQRSPNAYDYEFGNVYQANWYIKFLHPSVREQTYYLSSRDRFGESRSLFHMPLKKIDDLFSLYVQNGWVHCTKHCKSDEEMIISLELRILGALKVLGHNAPFQTLKSNMNISDKEHRMFFTQFIHHIYSIRDEYIGYPKTEEELAVVVEPYERCFLPGCGGSVDVVHVKWGHCPAAEMLIDVQGRKVIPLLPLRLSLALIYKSGGYRKHISALETINTLFEVTRQSTQSELVGIAK